MIKTKVAFWMAVFFPANQSNLKSFQKCLIGWKNPALQKCHFCFDYVNRLNVRQQGDRPARCLRLVSKKVAIMLLRIAAKHRTQKLLDSCPIPSAVANFASACNYTVLRTVLGSTLCSSTTL